MNFGSFMVRRLQVDPGKPVDVEMLNPEEVQLEMGDALKTEIEYFLQSDNTPQYSDGMNFQTRSQLNWVQGVDNERVVLIRLERFEEDMNRAIDQGLVDSRFGQIEFGIRAPRTIYRDFFTESARQLVEKAFAADIKRFKYEF